MKNTENQNDYVFIPRVATIRKAANHFGISEYCVRAAIQSGKVKCLSAESRTYVSIPSLAAHLHCTCPSGYTQIKPMAKINAVSKACGLPSSRIRKLTKDKLIGSYCTMSNGTVYVNTMDLAALLA